ncbi:MAG: S46 family peptidase [Paludibacter sp.]|nr:S46 family peptidase [Paludibacter sp.]
MKKISALFLLLVLFMGVRADEGMWMLPLIEKLNIQKMNGMGCTLTADEIYSDKNVSLKDAVIVFGNGCTGVVVSNQGLVFTNHHCGFSAIQQHSTVEHNYLKDGFTAETLADEIPTPNLTVKFLVSITDVTERVLSQLPDELMGEKRSDKQDSILSAIKTEFGKDNDYLVQAKSFFAGNEFYVFMFEEFKDIRFCYAPPSSIGKFGGDTDNWMWPRHTGDFSVFRVYSDKDGKPAEYSKDNVPYTPKRFATISNKGYASGDYTMILGNPGTTTRYLTSWGVENRMKTSNQARIDIRGAKQAVWKSFMRSDEAINIAYASKFARSSNYWKNSIGMNNAILKLGVLDQKKEEQKAFAAWVNEDPKRKLKHGKTLDMLEEGYEKIFPYSHAMYYLRESLINGVEMPGIASKLADLSKKNVSKDSVLNYAAEVYKDYYQMVDEATMAVMLKEYKKAVSEDALPEIYTKIGKKYKNNFEKFSENLFSKSNFSSIEKFTKAFKSGKVDFVNDPAILFREDVDKSYNEMHAPEYTKAKQDIEDGERLYEAGLKEIASEKGQSMYPDANFTMRLTYGKVGGYKPADAVSYKYYTTTKGVLEKEKPGDYEFDVPSKLKEAIEDKNYGAYLDTKTGEMHVAFLSNNDITGGNSGSPIFNAEGELLGLAFDGNWEAMSGDIVFEPDLQRTISVDIRYVLFIMDKVGGAQRLINELSIK